MNKCLHVGHIRSTIKLFICYVQRLFSLWRHSGASHWTLQQRGSPTPALLFIKKMQRCKRSARYMYLLLYPTSFSKVMRCYWLNIFVFGARFLNGRCRFVIEGFHSVTKRHHNCYKFVVRHPVLWRLKSSRASRRILAASVDEVHPKLY